MSLTDDWKARKLKAGAYYVRLSNGRVTGCWYYLDIFVDKAKYIGKSKASIKDLFEVKR